MKKLWKYILILLAVILFWNQLVLQPLILFSLVFHKLGHALTAFISGYGYDAFKVIFSTKSDIVIQPKGWFSSFMVLNGGYIGSLLFAGMVLLLKKTAAKRFIPGTLAIIYLLISISYPAFDSIIIYPVIFTSLIIIQYMIGNDSVNEFFIDVLGISILAYVIFDTFICTLLLTINKQFSIIDNWKIYPANDIVGLSKLTNLPSLLWGVIWLVIAVFILNFVLHKDSKSRR